MLKDVDIEYYNKQYTNLDVKYDNSWHDRYIILDRNTFYSLGTSFNYLGSKTFGINLIEELEVKKLILKKLEVKK